jgi:epoxyqueuosine reductase
VEQFFAEAEQLGLDAVAVTHAEKFTECLWHLEKIKSEGHYPDFTEQDLQIRIDPKAVLPSAKTIISTAIAYKTELPKLSPQSGLLSRYAWGIDYHRVLTHKLETLAEWMQKNLGVKNYAVCVDTKPTLDRAIFLRAGLGWRGKNCCVFHPQFGSWIFLGSILVDVELPQINPHPFSSASPCDKCDLCIQACPTGALFAPYRINPYICISYLTQMKGFIPVELRAKIGVKLWGCDNCQQVCPINKQAPSCSHLEFAPKDEQSIPVIPLLNISNREFKHRFGDTPMGWRGRSVIQRNAAIVCGNLQLGEAVSELKTSLEDPKRVVRGTAAWALGKIGTKKAREILADHKTKETDLQVLAEIELALTSQ